MTENFNTIITIWVVSHILTLFYLYKSKFITSSLIVLLIIFLYSIKPDTYDLNWYIPYFEDPYPRVPIEFAFFYITLYFSKVINLSPREILTFWQLVIFVFLYLACLNFGSKNRFQTTVAILLSVIYTITSQGALRQGISLALCLYGLSFIYRDKNLIIAVLFGVISTFFHASEFLFFLIGCLLITSSMNVNESKVFKFNLYWPLFFFLGCLAYYYLSLDITYGNNMIDWGEGRTSSPVKLLAIAFSLFVSEFIAGISVCPDSTIPLRRIRFYYFIFLIPVCFTSEGFSRLAYFYYGIELMLLSNYIQIRSRRRLLYAGLFIFITYSLAPNCINIITGRGAPPEAYSNFQ